MSVKEIERRYEEVARRICEVEDERERVGREVETEKERLVEAREMERRVWGRLRGKR